MNQGIGKNGVASLFFLAQLAVLGAWALFLSAQVWAAPAPEGWVDQRAVLISPEAAERLIEKRAKTLARERDQQGARQRQAGVAPMMAAETMTVAQGQVPAATEFSQLATALHNDPRRIYQFVRNHFTYVPYYGALKGPYLTLKERSGNDFDQAALLVELLRAAGYPAQYQYGSMTIPVSAANGLDLAHWLGAEADANVIGTIIATGGIPAVNYGTRFTLDRVWVVATVNGNTVALDPAFKPSEKGTGIGLAAAMGYDQAALLGAAGGVTGSDSMQSLDAGSLGNALNALTTQLAAHLQQNYPNARVLDITGGLTLIPDDGASLPAALPFAGTPTQSAWTEIPAGYVHTVRLQHGGLDTTLNIPQIAGRKLSLSYAGDTTPIDPPPANAVDFGSVAPGQDGPTVTWTPGNPNSVAIQVTSTLTGAGAGAFQFVSGGGTQTIPAGGSVQVKVKFTGAGQTQGRKNATLTFHYTYQGNAIGTQTVALTGAVVATPAAELYLDDTLLLSEGTPAGNLTSLTLTVDHPYGNGFADQAATFAVKRSGSYVLAQAFGGDRDSSLLAERQRRLDQLTLQGAASGSREVLSETLNVIGLSWMQQTQWAADLLAAVSDQRILAHHRFGLIAQEEGYYVDVKAQFTPVLPQSAQAPPGAFQALGLIASAMEHGVLEQLQGAGQPALSTIKVFALNNQNGQKFFKANAGNFASIWGQLSGYSSDQPGSDDYTQLQNAINAGATLILPQNGQVTLNAWRGKGYIDYRVSGSQKSLGMIIGGGLNGGYNSHVGPVNTAVMQAKLAPQQLQPAEVVTQKAADPVDLGSGAYLNQASDLSLGGADPRGLRFTRAYNSQQVNQATAGLGRGWSHGYHIRLSRHSDVKTALGLRSPRDAAALMVAAWVTRDLLSPTQPSLKAWTVGALVAKWATDQLQDQAMTARLGDRALTYRQLPDGSYVAPPGVTTRLVQKTDGTYELRERFGGVWAFDAQNRLQRLTDVDGNALTFTYTGDLLTQVQDAYNRTLSLTYTSGQLTQVADNQGRAVSYGYTGADLTSFRDAENKLWQYAYDGLHRITAVTDPLNVAIVSNTYDGHGRVTQQTAPRQTGSALYKLHYTGVSSAEEDPQGHRTTYHYDGDGRTVAVENALGQTTKTAYDGQGHVIQQTDPLGHLTAHAYDGNHNRTQTQNALSQTTGFNYDSQFRLIRITDPLTHTAEIDYDAEHHPVAARNALGQQTSSAYTAAGLVQSQTDAKNTATVYTYDTNGHPATAKTGAHPPITTQYDAIGRLTSLTDPAGAATQFQYDRRSLLIQRTDPLGKLNTSQYDHAGRLVSHTDRNGQTVTTSYTPSGKLAQIVYPGNQTVRFAYDELDRLTGMTDPAGTTSNTYDATGRLTGHTDPNGFQVQYQYDAAGNLTRLTYPGNKTVSYGYDALNRLQTVTVDWLDKTETYSYDAAGRLTQANRFNGSQTSHQYDHADRLTRLTHTGNGQTLAQYQYTLDANGNRTQALVTEPRLPEQLINRMLAHGYNPQKNRLTTAGATNYTYDLEGQLQTAGGTGYTFDAAHRLTGQGATTYTYDGVGNRIKATRNGQTTKYVHDAAGNLLAEADQNNVIRRYYIHGHGLTALVDANTNALYVYHFDGTGHTVALTNASKQTVNTYAYDPYGRLMAKTETITQPFQYAGQVGILAEGNNLYYMRARYYDANVGRFISEDPIGFDGGLNLYAYVGGNPILLVDPFGLSPESIAWNAARGLLVGAAGTVVVGAAAVGAVAIGTPVAAVTAGLGVLAAAGTAVTSYNIGSGIQNGDWDSVAYHAGSLAGSIATGAAGARLVRQGVTGETGGEFRFNDSAQNYKRELGSIWNWLDTGPTIGSAGLSIGAGGSGASGLLGRSPTVYSGK
jgi:RHS repeat-associated protein